MFTGKDIDSFIQGRLKLNVLKFLAINLNAGNYSVTVSDSKGCSFTTAVTINQPTALSLSTSTTVSTCGNSNGSALSNISGGIPGYTYLWSPGNSTAHLQATMEKIQLRAVFALREL